MTEETLHVSTTKELLAALKTVEGGETITLAPGSYGSVSLWDGMGIQVDFPSNVTIKSAEPDDPAIFSKLEVIGVSNLTFDSILFDYDAVPGAPFYAKPYKILDSQNITIKNSTFDGDLAEGVDQFADGYATGYGLTVGSSEGIVIENNEFSKFYMGIGVGGSDDIIVRGNEIHSMRSDGLTFTGVTGVLIEENYIHDFERSPGSGDHADMIQFWTINNNRATTDVVIRNNFLDIGEGDTTQSIFMGNEAVSTQNQNNDMFYQNIEISGNLIINSHLNGIRLGQTDGAIISDNILLHSDGGSDIGNGQLKSPLIRIHLDSVDVSLTSNTSATNVLQRDGWNVDSNTFVQNIDPEATGYYSGVADVFPGTKWEFLTDPEKSNYDQLAYEEQDEKTEGDDLGELAPVFNPDYSIDFASLVETGKLYRNAEFDATQHELTLNGEDDYVKLGKLHEYQDTAELSIGITYNSVNNNDLGIMLHNHGRFEIGVVGDKLHVRVATEDEGFKRFLIEGIDHSEDINHDLLFSLDREEDRLQIVLDGKIVLDETDTDFKQQQNQHNWGYSVGNQWWDSFEGSVYEIGFSDNALFL